jgi:hypothetical protein
MTVATLLLDIPKGDHHGLGQLAQLAPTPDYLLPFILWGRLQDLPYFGCVQHLFPSHMTGPVILPASEPVGMK